MFTTPDLKKAIAKNVGEQVCQLYNQTTKVPRIGCDNQNLNRMECSYRVRAMCMVFPDAEDETYEKITFQFPMHKAAVDSRKEENIFMKAILC